MNKLSILVALSLAVAYSASASPLYVSGSGNDSNSCNISSPCRTFAGALAHGAIFNSIIALDSSDFGNGSTLNITGVTVTIDGGVHGAFLSQPADSPVIVLALSSNIVTIRNITILPSAGLNSAAITGTLSSSVLNLENITAESAINNAGNGIQLQMDSTSQANLTDVTVTEGATGLMFSPHSGLTVKDRPPAPFNVSLERVLVEGCTNAGLLVLDGNATVRDSTFRNSNIGVQFSSPSASSNSLIEHSQMVDNNVGVFADAPYTVRLSNSVISNTELALEGVGTFISFRNNVFAGNISDGSISLSTSLK